MVVPPSRANQKRLLRYIEWLKTSDEEPGHWDDYAEYSRGESRWLDKDMCYDIAAKLTPMAIFTMVGHPAFNKAVYELSSHSVALELRRFTSTSLLHIAQASNYIGFSERHFYMLPSSNLDEHRLRSCIRSIVKTIKEKQGNGMVFSWPRPMRQGPSGGYEYPFIYTLPNDINIRNEAHTYSRREHT